MKKARRISMNPHTWGMDDVLNYVKNTGKADIEQDAYGNIVIYPCLHEDDDGYLCEGNLNEEGEVST